MDVNRAQMRKHQRTRQPFIIRSEVFSYHHHGHCCGDPRLPEPELLIAGSVAPPIRASDAALVRITMDEEIFRQQTARALFFQRRTNMQPQLPLKPSCDNAQFNFAESRIKRIAANGTSLTNFRISASVVWKAPSAATLARPLPHTPAG